MLKSLLSPYDFVKYIEINKSVIKQLMLKKCLLTVKPAIGIMLPAYYRSIDYNCQCAYKRIRRKQGLCNMRESVLVKWDSQFVKNIKQTKYTLVGSTRCMD